LSLHFSSHVEVLLFPNRLWLALQVVTHHLLVGSAKYFTVPIIGHWLTQSLVESKSEKVPYEAGHKSVHKLDAELPTQLVGQF